MSDINKIWAEIIESEKKTVLQSHRLDGEITIYEFMDETGLSKDKAEGRLSKLIIEGKLTVRKKIYVTELGGIYNLYHPVVDNEDK